MAMTLGATTTIAACTGATKTTSPVSTSVSKANTITLPMGIIYSRENPGKWVKKVGGHAPNVTVKANTVSIETKHGMSKKHYIVRHTLVSSSGEILGTNTFSPLDDQAISIFEIPDGHKELYATSFCNKHDMWVEKFSV